MCLSIFFKHIVVFCCHVSVEKIYMGQHFMIVCLLTNNKISDMLIIKVLLIMGPESENMVLFL